MMPHHSILLLWLLIESITNSFTAAYRNVHIDGRNFAVETVLGKEQGYFDQRQTGGNYYLDSETGRVLGNDGDSTDEVRVISRRKFDEISRKYSTTTSQRATKELKSNSTIIAINEQLISRDIDSVDAKSRRIKLEHQIYIVLKIDTTERVPNAQITSAWGIVGTKYGSPFQPKDYKGALRLDSSLIVLAQVHGHPPLSPPDWNNEGPSVHDGIVASKNNIPICAIDSYKTKDVWIGRIMPSGIRAARYCTMRNKRNIGKDALEAFIGK